MKNLFFGDSITSGENNDGKSFVEYIPHSEKVGVSGTTIGEYSIYPVDGNSLLSLIPRNIEKIKKAENIFLEYGINDATSVVSGYIKPAQITIDYVKVIDYIKQINPKAKLYFLVANNAAEALSLNNYNYLKTDYLKKYWDNNFTPNHWMQAYLSMIEFVVKPSGITIIEMFNDNNELKDNLDKDKLHPNNKGYQIIAENIKKELYKEWKLA